MPLGWERINEKRTSPNKNIVFLKPRPGPHEATSKDFLERIAAQCLPIMNKHHLSVVSLEEYEPNLEFWGRNFNNGEVIQLVLKSPKTGNWLPFKFVQMVMMHELAHCKQMNHSKAFWKVRNEFSADLKALWERGYTGDGLWGRGILLENGAFAREELDEGEALPEHLCGGTFKSSWRGRKRKLKPKITYREQQERRIRRKFGENGQALGGDDMTKRQLEGKWTSAKPRVAGSARGRELRAAAALARFEVKEATPKDEDLVSDSETQSEDEDDVIVKTEPDEAIDINGKALLDSKGNRMVRVCEDEDKDDENAKREFSELQDFQGSCKASRQAPTIVSRKPSLPEFRQTPTSRPRDASAPESEKVPWRNSVRGKTKKMHQQPKALNEDNISTASDASDDETQPKSPLLEQTKTKSKPLSTPSTEDENQGILQAAGSNVARQKPTAMPRNSTTEEPCPICSVSNTPGTLTCLVCSNVLRPEFVPNSWHCKSVSCKGSQFINAGDYGICQVCGARKSL
ncbi:hypothetical protein BP5796_05976 [Coleophoma crateriformis]|uniref:WLM domain-containing protein n=1 Tax=Coleophoma crateriformis TaxID=565419 RepID=A0A3D8RWA9_9HELO|nr:hypothetical protein BP5796_05976 [Coleophoma crateriformis]